MKLALVTIMLLAVIACSSERSVNPAFEGFESALNERYGVSVREHVMEDVCQMFERFNYEFLSSDEFEQYVRESPDFDDLDYSLREYGKYNEWTDYDIFGGYYAHLNNLPPASRKEYCESL